MPLGGGIAGMKTYRVQRNVDYDWRDFGIETQSIKYARGFQDAIQTLHPDWETRIVWVRGCRYETVRICGNWSPVVRDHQ